MTGWESGGGTPSGGPRGRSPLVNPTIVRLSVQALLGRRRGIVLMVIPALLLVLAVVVRALTSAGVGYDIVSGVGFTLGLPLVALLASSAVLGPEVDDGSIVYLLSKPVGRHVIAISKYAVAWLATIALGAVPLFVSGLVLDGSDVGRALGWGLAGLVSGTTYTALFLALAAFTRHAVVAGLLFVLLWEGLLGGLLSGIRWLSIGAWGAEVGSAVSDAIDAPGTSPAYALVAATLVTVVGIWFAGDRLRSFTLRGDE
jgi:ABC-2 type transport system permease protein